MLDAQRLLETAEIDLSRYPGCFAKFANDETKILAVGIYDALMSSYKLLPGASQIRIAPQCPVSNLGETKCGLIVGAINNGRKIRLPEWAEVPRIAIVGEARGVIAAIEQGALDQNAAIYFKRCFGHLLKNISQRDVLTLLHRKHGGYWLASLYGIDFLQSGCNAIFARSTHFRCELLLKDETVIITSFRALDYEKFGPQPF